MVISSGAKYTAAVLYFAFISFMFFLPGSALPSANWMSKVYFDKWVHIGFFSMLLLLWLWAIAPAKKGILLLLFAAVVYGISVEFIQDRFVPNRSFDLTDWAADITGSLIGIWFWNRYVRYTKK